MLEGKLKTKLFRSFANSRETFWIKYLKSLKNQRGLNIFLYLIKQTIVKAVEHLVQRELNILRIKLLLILILRTMLSSTNTANYDSAFKVYNFTMTSSLVC